MKKLLILLTVIFFIIPLNGQTDKPKDKKNKTDKKTAGKIPDGYGNLKWGISLNDAKKGLIGKIQYTDEKKIIITKDNDLEYYYGFFYDEKKKPQEKLFYVALKFPYLSLEEVKNTIKEKYGTETRENLIDQQGAIIWDSEKTIIIMWVDRYEKKPFSRRITYIAKDIALQLNEQQKNVFNKIENKIIEQLKNKSTQK